MQRQGTDTANEKKMLQRIKLTDKEVPDDIDKHSSCLNGYIRILYIYIYIHGFSAVYEVLLNAWVVKRSLLKTTWPYIYI